MTIRIAVLFCTSALVLVGCAADKASQRSEPTAQTGGQNMEQRPPMCPMDVKGVTVNAEDTEDGIAIVFTTDDPSQVEELRRRVQYIGEMHKQPHGMGMGMGGGGMHGHGHAHGEGHEHGEAHMGGEMQSELPPLSRDAIGEVRSEEVENGARVVFEASSPDRVEELRTAMRARADRMKSGACPMKAMGMQPEASGS